MTEEERKNVDGFKRRVHTSWILFLGAICGIISGGLLFISIFIKAGSTEKLQKIIIQGISLSVLIIAACFEVYSIYKAKKKNFASSKIL